MVDVDPCSHSIAAVDSSEVASTEAASGWRRTVGVSLFVLHLVLPLIAFAVVPILGLPEGVNAILLGASVVGGPDLLLVASIAVLGKDGVALLMSKLGSFGRKVTRWDRVTRRRYIAGLWVLAASLVLPTVILFFWDDSIVTIGGEPGWGYWVLLVSTFSFIGAVLSMGAPLWSRIQAIFTWEAEIVLPERHSSQV